MNLHQLTGLVLELAVKLASGREAAGLENLCLAAVKAYTGRLKPGVRVSDCMSALIPACAYAALSGLAAREGLAGGGLGSFRIGEVSVGAGGGGGFAQSAESLRGEAERLMGPYVRAEGFAFSTTR